MNYKKIILTQINDLLRYNDKTALEEEIVYFADEKHFSYENLVIQKSNIVDENLLPEFLKTITEGRSWIHANLIFTQDNQPLITICCGEKVGNPNPRIDVSYEPNKRVIIL